MAPGPTPRGVALATLVPLVLGGAVLLAGGTGAWPAWAGVLAVAAMSGRLAARRGSSARPPSPSAPAPPPPPRDRGGSAMYAMQRPVRDVPAAGLGDDAPFTLKATARSQLALIGPPGSGTGSDAAFIPLTGHNLVLSLAADGPSAVTLVRLEARVIEHASLVAEGVSTAHDRVPDMVLSPDLLESIQRSVAAYEPLRRPDFEARLDEGPASVRPVDESAPALPLTVPRGGSTTVVLAPVTGSGAWVHWELHAEIVCDGLAYRPSWPLTVTATTGMSTYHPGGSTPTPTPVHELHPDHWDPAARDDPRPRDGASRSAFAVAAHTTADGTGVLRGPSRTGPAPESGEGLRLRETGDRHLAAGRRREAADAYRAAAEAGSGQAALALGQLLHEQGDRAGARRWYELAAERRIGSAFNNLGLVALQDGRSEEAEHWYRRGMDEGDWAAADGLAALLAQRGDTAQAETLWRLATEGGRSNAAQNLAVLLNRQGRTAEAEELWVRAAEEGSDEAAVHAGFLRHRAGDLVAAERWWGEAAGRGHGRAAYYYGMLLARDGRADEAERWWRQAAERLTAPERAAGGGLRHRVGESGESGEALCAYELACLLDERGDRAGAERWWTAAARAGHLEAVLRVAQVAMNDHDDLDGCLSWLRIAVEDERTPVDRLATAADALRRLADGLYDATRPDNGDALAACSLAVEAYERLRRLDPAAHEEAYGRVRDLRARLDG